jgi:hypothetical protein
VAIDENGRPTTDADAARRGAILPFGGHKGYALALATHALGVLCSAAATEDSTGYLFIAFKPDLFLPLDDYRRALAAEIAGIKATPRQDGVAEIRIPGERAYRERASHQGGDRDRPAHSRGVNRTRAARPGASKRRPVNLAEDVRRTQGRWRPRARIRLPPHTSN